MRVLITFADRALPKAVKDACIRRCHGRVKTHCRHFPVSFADVPASDLDTLRRDPAVQAVEPDPEDAVHICVAPPYGITRLRAPELHTRGVLGAGVKVAVIDTGIDYNHVDLAPVYAGGFDFVNNDADPFDDHTGTHGTHVSGTIAARLSSSTLYGMAPSCQLFAVKVLDSSGSGLWSWLIDGYDWCITNGIQVNNQSLGGTAPPAALETAINAMADAGIISVCAAGNSGPTENTVAYPAKYGAAIAIGAIDADDVIASFSSRGPEVELCAPGVAVNSTIGGGGYALKNGTSMATPHVTGAVALALSTGVPARQIRGRLSHTAVDLGTAGRDTAYGYGRVDAFELINGQVGAGVLIRPATFA